MAIYGVFYGLIENNIRRSLAFSVINQLGFKILAVGLGPSCDCWSLLTCCMWRYL